MKAKIILLVVLAIVASIYWGHRFLNTFNDVLISPEMKESAAYTDECLLGKIVKTKNKGVLHFHIEDNEIYIDKINFDKKNEENINKISNKDLDNAVFSLPYIQSIPQYEELKNGNIFFTLIGLKNKKPIRFSFLYNPDENSYKKLDLENITTETNIFALEDKFIVGSIDDSNVISFNIFDNEGALIKTLTLKDKNYSAYDILKNEEIVILNSKRLPVATLDLNTYKISPFAKPVYDSMEAYTELNNGNLLFETSKGEKSALEIYDIEKKEFSNVIDNLEDIKTGITLGIIKLDNCTFIKMKNDYYAVNLLEKTYKKIEGMEDTKTSFPMIISENKILIDTKDGIKILNLLDGSLKDANKIKNLIGNVAYPIKNNKAIIINTILDKTMIYDKNKNEFEYGPRTKNRFFKNHPVQIVELDDGRIVLHYSVIYSTFEQKLGSFGRILDSIMIPLCKGADEGACMKYEKAPFYSRAYTEIY